MKYLPLILLIIGCSSANSPVIQWGGRTITYENNWVVADGDYSYPGNSNLINELVDSFNNSKVVRVGKVNIETLDFYGFKDNSFNNFLIGGKLPGDLGRYIYDLNRGILYRAFGSLNEFDLFLNLKDLDISRELSVGEVLFIDRDMDKLFEDDANIFVNNILRSDITDLVPNGGVTAIKVEIKYTNGRSVKVDIKKGEQGYSINLGSPFSYAISQGDFSIISSF